MDEIEYTATRLGIWGSDEQRIYRSVVWTLLNLLQERRRREHGTPPCGCLDPEGYFGCRLGSPNRPPDEDVPPGCFIHQA